ncbi:hypothetical protein [Hymenobacter lucidus]|uniref:DUF2812 domain-containing protein n=1 Tax=Hymenobacter lucidus TaxID=2880930 RepID=A0ABS8ARQ1_9BACT|nr:hypothetical protein [Hymenobacter lucidus]MCB2408764.1 hypothetical protein [Hymenobacter lucidus]
MRLYPSVTEQFYSPLPPEQLLQRIQANTASGFSWGWRAEPFRGRIVYNRFELCHLSWYTSPTARPQITGWVEFSSSAAGSVLRLRYRLQSFGIIGFSVVLLISLVILGVLIDIGTPNYLFYLVPVAITGFAAASLLIPFWIAVRHTKGILMPLLELQQ